MKVELAISVRGVHRLDLFSKSDPFAVVFVPDTRGQWRELGRTETAMNEHNPVFKRGVLLDYNFEEVQPIRFELYDSDSDARALERHDFIGRVDTKLGTIMGSRGLTFTRKLSSPGSSHADSNGDISTTLTVRAVEIKGGAW